MRSVANAGEIASALTYEESSATVVLIQCAPPSVETYSPSPPAKSVPSLA